MCVRHVLSLTPFGFSPSQILNKRFIKFSQRCPSTALSFMTSLRTPYSTFMVPRFQSKMARRPLASGLGMIYFLLMMCAFAEGFLLWVLVALIQDGLHF